MQLNTNLRSMPQISITTTPPASKITTPIQTLKTQVSLKTDENGRAHIFKMATPGLSSTPWKCEIAAIHLRPMTTTAVTNSHFISASPVRPVYSPIEAPAPPSIAKDQHVHLAAWFTAGLADDALKMSELREEHGDDVTNAFEAYIRSIKASSDELVEKYRQRDTRTKQAILGLLQMHPGWAEYLPPQTKEQRAQACKENLAMYNKGPKSPPGIWDVNDEAAQHCYVCEDFPGTHSLTEEDQDQIAGGSAKNTHKMYTRQSPKRKYQETEPEPKYPSTKIKAQLPTPELKEPPTRKQAISTTEKELGSLSSDKAMEESAVVEQAYMVTRGSKRKHKEVEPKTNIPSRKGKERADCAPEKQEPPMKKQTVSKSKKELGSPSGRKPTEAATPIQVQSSRKSTSKSPKLKLTLLQTTKGLLLRTETREKENKTNSMPKEETGTYFENTAGSKYWRSGEGGVSYGRLLGTREEERHRKDDVNKAVLRELIQRILEEEGPERFFSVEKWWGIAEQTPASRSARMRKDDEEEHEEEDKAWRPREILIDIDMTSQRREPGYRSRLTLTPQSSVLNLSRGG